jgi:hypothetical protein
MNYVLFLHGSIVIYWEWEGENKEAVKVKVMTISKSMLASLTLISMPDAVTDAVIFLLESVRLLCRPPCAQHYPLPLATQVLHLR